MCLITYSGIRQRHEDEVKAQRSALQLASLISSQYAETREGVRQLLGGMASLDELKDSDSCTSAMRGLLQQFSQYVNFGIADPQGNVICGALPTDQPVNIADRSYFQDAFFGQAFAAGQFQVGRVSGKPSIGYGYPVLDSDGRTTAVVVTTLDLAWISKALAKVQVPAGVVVTLFDRDGAILARYPDDAGWVGRQFGSSALFTTMQRARSGTFSAKGIDGEPRLYAFSVIGSAKDEAFLSVGLPRSLAFASADHHLQRNLALLSLVTLLAVLAAWVFGDVFIVKRMKTMVAASRRLAAGDLSARSGVPSDRGEIGDLGRAFDEMAASLSDRQAAADRAETLRMEENKALQAATQELAKRVEQLNGLYEVFSKITERLGTEAVVAAALSEVAKLVQAEVVVLRLVQDGELHVAGSFSRSSDGQLDLTPVHIGDGLIGRVAETGKAIRFESNAELQMLPGQSVTGAQSGVAVPVSLRGEVLGTLGCWSRQPGVFSVDDERLLTMMASQIATAIVAAETTETSERQARRDPLTGLPNRLAMEEDLEGGGGLDLKEAAVLAMVDIDNFKRFNDRFGHQVGDLILQQVAATIRRSMRENDRVYRYGGEEFLIVFPTSSPVEARNLAERVRQNIASIPLRHIAPSATEEMVTASLGVAAFPSDSPKLNEVLGFADQALYQAKAAGRNRVVVWSSRAQSIAA